MNTVKVTNLSTGEERTYMKCNPSRAVIYAHLDSIGRRNTWEYERLYVDNYPKLSWGSQTVAMGDWCALLKMGEGLV